MAYSTSAQVRVRLTSYIDTSIISDANLTYLIADGDSIINSYLCNLYTLPFSTTPSIIEYVSIMLACYHTLLSIYSRDTNSDNKFIDVFRKNAYDTLDNIRKGKLALTTSEGVTISRKTDAVISTTSGKTPIFNLDNAEDQEIHTDILDDISDLRS